MKYRRRPIDRDVIDAVLIDGHYVFAGADGEECRVPADEFDRDYQPARSASVPKKPRKPRTRKDSTTTITGAINNGNVPN